MIKGAIFALALVAGLVALASAWPQEKDKDYFEEQLSAIHKKTGDTAVTFAAGLGFNLYFDCGAFDQKAFAEMIEDPNSNQYKCSVKLLTKPGALINIFRHMARPAKETLLQYLDRIRYRNRANKNTLTKLVVQSKELCQKYVANTAQYFAEAAGTDYVDSDTYAEELLARDACQLYLKHGFSKETIAEAGKLADTKYNFEKARVEVTDKKTIELDNLRFDRDIRYRIKFESAN